ncbi:hypothetical protein N658DRAFT_517426 [Parathielavia hyrcaniae]|uniref:Uncharacterized protein n=1 Tax=Parathielavia hyrcaniae TaxID=113614 RepID=A0AAN6PWN5_9PEZI|nr:hypothetical protein N658DRAFT_517426 [Parathielavia hyrcaniae]
MEGQPPKYVSPPGTWKTKLGLRAASILFIIVLAGIGGSLATTPRVDTVMIIAVVLAPAIIVTFAWDVAEIVCILKRGGNRGIHPGAVVAIDLFAWLGWGCLLLFLWASGMATRPRYVIEDYSGYDGANYRYDESKVTPEDAALEKQIRGKGRAMIAFAIFAA